MPGKQKPVENQKNESFQILKEGFAKARFGGTLSGCPLPGTATPFSFAPGESAPDNGGLNAEEYVARYFRILSAAMTPYRYFDFSREGVLKAATQLFDGLTLYANHNADVTRWKGMCQGPVWDDQNDPPGINALLAVDKTIDANLARGVETKALRSCSVTIWFEYEKSHPNLDYYWSRLGEEVDGEIVRLIVTKITNAGEVSIVWEGEDPHAKALGAPESFSAPDDSGEQHHTSTEGESMKLSQKLAVLLALTVGADITPEALEAAVTGKIEALQTERDSLKADADLGKQLLTETRTQAETLYKGLKGESALERFITGVIRTADLATARALCEEYEAAVDKAAPLSCPKCGVKFTRLSSQPEQPEPVSASGKRTDDYKL